MREKAKRYIKWQITKLKSCPFMDMIKMVRLQITLTHKKCILSKQQCKVDRIICEYIMLISYFCIVFDEDDLQIMIYYS